MSDKDLGADAAAGDGSMATSADTAAPHVARYWKCCRCSSRAVWQYMPDGERDEVDCYFCGPCVPKGCSCNDGDENAPCVEYDYNPEGFIVERDDYAALALEFAQAIVDAQALQDGCDFCGVFNDSDPHKGDCVMLKARAFVESENENQPLSEASGSVPSAAQKS